MAQRLMTSSARKRIRKRLFEWNKYCHWCGDEMLLHADGYDHKNPHPDFATIEHLHPVAAGGDEFDIENMVLAHMKCNR